MRGFEDASVWWIFLPTSYFRLPTLNAYLRNRDFAQADRRVPTEREAVRSTEILSPQRGGSGAGGVASPEGGDPVRGCAQNKIKDAAIPAIRPRSRVCESRRFMRQSLCQSAEVRCLQSSTNAPAVLLLGRAQTDRVSGLSPAQEFRAPTHQRAASRQDDV